MVWFLLPSHFTPSYCYKQLGLFSYFFGFTFNYSQLSCYDIVQKQVGNKSKQKNNCKQLRHFGLFNFKSWFSLNAGTNFSITIQPAKILDISSGHCSMNPYKIV